MHFKNSLAQSAYNVLINESHLNGSKVIALGKMGTVMKQVGKDGSTEGDEIYKVKFEDGSVQEISAREMEMQGDENRKPSENEIEDLVKEGHRVFGKEQQERKTEKQARKLRLLLNKTKKNDKKKKPEPVNEAAPLLAFGGAAARAVGGFAARAAGSRLVQAPMRAAIGSSARGAAAGQVGRSARAFRSIGTPTSGLGLTQRAQSLAARGADAVRSGAVPRRLRSDLRSMEMGQRMSGSVGGRLMHRAATTAPGRAGRAVGRLGKRAYKAGYTSPVDPTKPKGARSFDPMKAYITTDIATSVMPKKAPPQPKPEKVAKPLDVGMSVSAPQYTATPGGGHQKSRYYE